MKIRFIFLPSFLLVLFAGCSAIKDTNVIYQDLINQFPSRDLSIYMKHEQLCEDLSFLANTIKEVNPNPYNAMDRMEFTEALEGIKQSFDSITIAEFYKQIAPKVIALHLDHTFVEIP